MDVVTSRSIQFRNKMQISSVTNMLGLGSTMTGCSCWRSTQRIRHTRSIEFSAVGASLPNRKMILATIFVTAQIAMHWQSVGEAVLGYNMFWERIHCLFLLEKHSADPISLTSIKHSPIHCVAGLWVKSCAHSALHKRSRSLILYKINEFVFSG